MTKVFEESLSLFKDKISDCIKSNKSISITTHNDCDGLTSGSIITKALIREGAKCTIRTSKEFSKNVVQSFKTCLLYTSPSPRDQRGSRMPSSA